MTPESESPDRLGKMLYEQAAESLKQQRASLDEMRSRTGALLSASSISNAFLGAAASGGTGKFHLPARFLIALVPFGLSLILCIGVLWYSKGWKFSLRSVTILETVPSTMPLEEVYYQLTRNLESMYDQNEEKIEFRSRIFSSAAFFTAVAVVAWLILIE